MDNVIQEFVQRHNVVMTEAVERESTAIYWTWRARTEVDALESSVAKLGNLAAFISYLMLIRIFGYTEGSLIAFITGEKNSASVIARTVAESAITLIYILQDDRANRLARYFLHSIEKERHDIDKLRTSKGYANLPSSAFDNLTRRLDLLENFVTKKVAREIGSATISSSWPNMFELFEKSGYEKDYRTVYAQMSSKVHNTPTRFLDVLMFMNYAFHSGDEQTMNVRLEALTGADRVEVYAGVLYCLEAASKYSTSFGLTEGTDDIFRGIEVISTTLSQMMTQLEQLWRQ